MSLLHALFSTLDQQSLSGIADALGQSDQQSVSQGMQSAIGTVLGGVANKSENPNFLRKILDLVPSGAGDVSWSTLSSSVADPNSPMMSAGKQMLSTIFGGAEGALARALGAGTGLQHGVTSSLMSMAAPMVLSFLQRQVRYGGLNMEGLGNLLQREIPSIRAVLPAGVTSLLWPEQREAMVASPAAVQTATARRSTAGWLIPLLLLALIPALFWLFGYKHKPVAQIPPPAAGIANRAAPEVPTMPKSSLPGNMDLYFDTGLNRLRPDSYARLVEFAAALAKTPGARVIINGYTDNVGNATSNIRLSQERADAIKANLVSMGISADRLTAQGFGEENPIADNATAKGRELNRRVTVKIGNP